MPGPHRPGAPPHRTGGGGARAGGPPRAARTAGRRVLPSWHRPSGDEGGRYWPSSDSDEGGPVMRVGPRPGAKRGEEAAHAGKIHWHSWSSIPITGYPTQSFWLVLNWHPVDDLRWYDGRSGEERRRKIEVCVDVRYISEVYIFMIESGCFQPPCKRCLIRFFAMRLESSLLAKDSGV